MGSIKIEVTQGELQLDIIWVEENEKTYKKKEIMAKRSLNFKAEIDTSVKTKKEKEPLSPAKICSSNPYAIVLWMLW